MKRTHQPPKPTRPGKESKAARRRLHRQVRHKTAVKLRQLNDDLPEPRRTQGWHTW